MQHQVKPKRSEAAPPQRRLLKRWIAVDFVMMGLLLINLLLLVFEMLYRAGELRSALQAYLPRLAQLYARTIHAHFLVIDLGFVAIYLAELIARWISAVRQQVYERWYAYPLIHWYDVLGSIPVGTLRFLRILRVFAIVVRLHRLGLVDLRETWLYSVLMRYKEIASEEISDRVVVRVLEGVQGEVSAGTPVIERIWTEVIAPRKDLMLDYATARLTEHLKQELRSRSEEIHLFSDALLADALQRSRLVPLQFLPVVGERMSREIERIVREVVENVIARLLDEAGKLDEGQLRAFVQHLVAEALPRGDERTSATVRQMVLESIEILKDQVRVKRWQLDREAPEEGGDHPALPAAPGTETDPASPRFEAKEPDPHYRYQS